MQKTLRREKTKLLAFLGVHGMAYTESEKSESTKFRNNYRYQDDNKDLEEKAKENEDIIKEMPEEMSC